MNGSQNFLISQPKNDDMSLICNYISSYAIVSDPNRKGVKSYCFFSALRI